MAIFTGAGVAIVTPMKENGEVNYDKVQTVQKQQYTFHRKHRKQE